MKTQGKTRITKKMVVTQDNKFIYAKYNMSANEMKFFMWIVGQINNQKDQPFQICKVPLNQVIDIWQWNKNRVLQIDYAYIREICHSISKKVYIEDFKLLDEKNYEKRIALRLCHFFNGFHTKMERVV